MTSAREIMTPNPEYVSEAEPLTIAAQKMRDLDVGSLPICDSDGKVVGMVTDRDVVVKCVAEGGDPGSTTAGSLSQGTVYSVAPDENIEHALEIMEQQQVRRLPIIEDGMLVGMLAQADIARSMQESRVGEVVEEISKR